MKTRVNQLEFSSVFFDTIFGLIIFFNIDSFLLIKDPIHFIFYLFGVIIVAHWWLMFKSVDDYFGEEATRSALDLVFGIIYLIFLAYMVSFAESFNYQLATLSLLFLFGIDLIWALVWQYVGHWRTRDESKIRVMEQDLAKTIKINLWTMEIFVVLLGLSVFLNSVLFVILFGVAYATYIYLTFRYKVVDFDVF